MCASISRKSENAVGLASRRELTRSHAKQMVATREAKRAALKAGKPWPPRGRKSLKLRNLS